MKAPKNFYNTVDQSKLGIDDLFTRTAENESDIAALETVVGDDTTGLVKSVSDLEDVVGDSTTGLVKNVSDLETVVGDINGGLVKDVHDLQDDSEQYHDDIEDLKAADITLGLRIDDLSDDVKPKLYYDVNSITYQVPGGNIILEKNVNEVITDIINSGKVPRLCIVSYDNSFKEYANVYSIAANKIIFYTVIIVGANNDAYFESWTFESSNTTKNVSVFQKKLT